MNKLLAALMLLLFFACGNEPKTNDSPSDDQSTEQPEIKSAEKNSEPATTPSEPVSKLGPGLNLWIADAEAEKGTEFCLDVTMSETKGLLSMQYSLRWDPKVLQFNEIKGFTLPGMDVNDFGAHKSKEGTLTAVWIDDTLQGVNTNDGDLLYQLCFTALGDSGTETPVRFWSTPTPYEVVVLPETIIPLTAHKRVVKIR